MAVSPGSFYHPNPPQSEQDCDVDPRYSQQPDANDHLPCPLRCGRYMKRIETYDHVFVCRHRYDMKLRIPHFTDFGQQQTSSTREPSPSAVQPPTYKDVLVGTNNPINRLQDHCIQHEMPLPNYADLGMSGPPHDPTFTCCVSCSAALTMIARGPTKRDAKKKAAELLLAEIRRGRFVSVPNVMSL